MAERLVEGLNVVLTGCNRGIGKATLTTFAENGANIYTITRKEREDFSNYCGQLIQRHGVTIENFYADFKVKDEVTSAAKGILSMKVPIDVIVNNVGIGNKQAMLQMTSEDTFRNVLEINFFSSIWLTQILSRSMIKNKKGSIIFISSAAAFDGGANVDYCASKAALIGASKRLAIELGAYGIRVNVIAPSLTESDMGNSMSEEDEAIALNANIMHRKGKTREIANAVLFMASDLSSFITAQTLRVDGGGGLFVKPKEIERENR